MNELRVPADIRIGPRTRSEREQRLVTVLATELVGCMETAFHVTPRHDMWQDKVDLIVVNPDQATVKLIAFMYEPYNYRENPQDFPDFDTVQPLLNCGYQVILLMVVVLGNGTLTDERVNSLVENIWDREISGTIYVRLTSDNYVWAY